MSDFCISCNCKTQSLNFYPPSPYVQYIKLEEIRTMYTHENSLMVGRKRRMLEATPAIVGSVHATG